MACSLLCPESARKLKLSKKNKIKTLFLLHTFYLSETVPAKFGGGCPVSLLPQHFGFWCWSLLQYKLSVSLWEREKSSQKRKTWFWLTVSEVFLRGCAAPTLLGMWQGRNIMMEGKLFTSCRQDRDWEQEERCGREDQTHVQQPSSNYHLAFNSPFSGKLINDPQVKSSPSWWPHHLWIVPPTEEQVF